MFFVLQQKTSRKFLFILLAAVLLIGFHEINTLVNPYHVETTMAGGTVKPTIMQQISFFVEWVSRKISKHFGLFIAGLVECE